MPLAQAVANRLVALGRGTLGLDLLYAYQPDTPNDLLCVFDESAPTLVESNVIAIEQDGIQILVRAKKYADAYTRARQVHEDLVGYGGTLDPAFPPATVITCVTPPTSIGQDKDGRAEFSAHYAVLYHPASAGHRG